MSNNNLVCLFNFVNVCMLNPAPPIEAPSNFRAVSITSTSVTLHWDSQEGSGDYRVQVYIITCTERNTNVKVSTGFNINRGTMNKLTSYIIII